MPQQYTTAIVPCSNPTPKKPVMENGPLFAQRAVRPQSIKMPFFKQSRLQLGPSWVLVSRNALEINVEEKPLALEICLND